MPSAQAVLGSERLTVKRRPAFVYVVLERSTFAAKIATATGLVQDSLFVKDRDHAMCQRVVCDLRDLQEFVFIDRPRAVLVELHESFLEPVEFGRRDCEGKKPIEKRAQSR